MKRPECVTYNGMGRQQHRRQWAELGKGVVESYLAQFGILGAKPKDIAPSLRPLVEVAHLNWRLIRNGSAPLGPIHPNTLLDQIGRTPRGLQFAVLDEQGLLKRAI